MRIEIKREVLDAAARLLSREKKYEGLKLTGNEESAKRFHDDVMTVCEFVGECAAVAIIETERKQ